MSKGRRIANLPDWAETQFQLLCDEAGVTRNKSSQDRSGWDYIVEFERELLIGLPHDRQLGPATARIQIKSKSGGTPRTELKLTNALRFCREPDPCFIVLALLSRDGLFKRLFAREFDKDLMEATLKRAREADRDNRQDLHRIRVPVAFRDNDDRTSDLLEWIRARSVGDSTDYAAEKARLNRALGYEEPRVVGTLTFLASDTQLLIEHAVGLQPSFNVERVEMREQRFDIPARTPIFEGKPDFFALKVPPRKASITFQGEGGREAVFEGEYRSMNLPGLGREHHRATFTSPSVTGAMIGEGPFNLNYHFSSSRRQSLSELQNQVAFFIACRSPVTPKFNIEGQMLEMLPLTVPIEQQSAHDWLDRILSLIARTVRRSDRPSFSADEIAADSVNIERFADGISDGNMRLLVNFENESTDVPKVRSLLYYAALELGDSTLTYIAKRACMSHEYVHLSATFDFTSPVILEQAARRGPITRHIAALRRRFENILDKMGPGIVTLSGGDLMRIEEGGATITTD